MARQCATDAMAELAILPDSPARRALEQFAHLLVDRLA